MKEQLLSILPYFRVPFFPDILKDGARDWGGVHWGTVLWTDVTITLMNTQQLWLPAQEQTSQNSGINKGGAPQAIAVDEKLLAV